MVQAIWRQMSLPVYTSDLTSLVCSGQFSSEDECATAPQPSAFVDIALQVHTITLTSPLDSLILQMYSWHSNLDAFLLKLTDEMRRRMFNASV